MLFSTLGPSSLPVVVPQPDERHANRAVSVLEWYDITKHRKTSSSNEEEGGFGGERVKLVGVGWSDQAGC